MPKRERSPDPSAPSGSGSAPPDAARYSKTKRHDSPVAPCPTPPVLAIQQVAFQGNHVVEKDTLGPFPSPEWIRGRADAAQSPVCYTRRAQVQLEATFKVTKAPSARATVRVEGKCTVDGVSLTWTGLVAVDPADLEVTAFLTSAEMLPAHVGRYTNVQITWTGTPESPAGGPFNAGPSKHDLYVTLGDPQCTPHWTLLEISCRAANGESAPGGVITKICKAFSPANPNPNMTRKRDGQKLGYWNPNVPTAGMDSQGILAHAQGSGQCGGWSSFLLDMFNVHGITGGRKVYVEAVLRYNTRAFNLAPVAPTGDIGFTVKTVPGTTQSVPGQNSPSPPPGFYNHFIVQAPINDLFYDPSYGSGPFPDAASWRASSIEHISVDPDTVVSVTGAPLAAAPLGLSTFNVYPGLLGPTKITWHTDNPANPGNMMAVQLTPNPPPAPTPVVANLGQAISVQQADLHTPVALTLPTEQIVFWDASTNVELSRG